MDTPQCFSAEMYSVDLNITGKPEDDKVVIFVIASKLSSFSFHFLEYLNPFKRNQLQILDSMLEIKDFGQSFWVLGSMF